MVRVVIGSDRYAFVDVTDSTEAVADGPVRHNAHLWKNGRLVVLRRLVRERGQRGASPERQESFERVLHDYVPRLPAVDDDTAERWLRGLMLAFAHEEASAPMSREGTRRVLRERISAQIPGGGRQDSLLAIEASLDDAGAWDVQVREDVTADSEAGTALAPVEGRIRGSVSVGSGERIGGDEDFDDAPVVQGMRRRLSAIRACYETQLRASPRLAGRVRVELTVDTTGPVRDVRVTENTMNLPEVGACVALPLSRLRVTPGPAAGSVTLSYPFEFSPQS